MHIDDVLIPISTMVTTMKIVTLYYNDSRNSNSDVFTMHITIVISFTENYIYIFIFTCT